ncbi:LysR family transcriptional regulator [Microbacterium sp. MRS-1]|uniref:LysR family transcriptional regulator n=1 Tax=Microbacterium sp. MRS-1 TaxID=1451261 RepID=UPI000446F5C5|nr:LysR family transcriptional regulator [Microbacterium sp. MRS-1]EXJ51811.1 LysR family transcriptional regulator [Microbacterium sp. MRS-1]MBN9151220.1 LysR family transcriptional regulator [Micrococcales bacterium]
MDEWVGRFAPQLRALVELDAQDGHVTQAAAVLRIPQSSMSRRLHALEEELGVPLLVRDGRQVRLTPAARDLAARVRTPLRLLETALEAVTGAADPDHGTIRFGFPLTMGTGRVPDLLTEFHRVHPGIRLLLKQAHGAELFEDLHAGRLDLAITIPPPDDLDHVILAAQPIVVALAEQHSLAGRARIKLSELREATFIANPASYHLRALTEAWCQGAGFAPRVLLEITEFDTMRELIARNLGVALLPRAQRDYPGLTHIPLTGSERFARGIALASSPAPLTAAANRLHEFLIAGYARH